MNSERKLISGGSVKRSRREITKGHKAAFGVMDIYMFINLIVVMVSQT